MSNVFNLVSEETYIEQTDKIARFLAAIAAGNSGALKPTSWADVQAIVRAGLAGKVFAVGDQLTCQRDGVNLVWDIIGIDHDTPADPQFTHSLTLQLHDCFPTTMQFDAPEALYYCHSVLTAGTHRFRVSGADYQFTTSADIDAGSQLILNFTDNTPTSIFVSATVGGDFVKDTNDTDNLTIAVTAGSGGTPLDTDYINDINRVNKGSNNYKESAIRQWLNSNAVAGSVWSPQTNFDRPPTWAASVAGFLNGMDADFLDVIGNVSKITAKNSVTDGGGYDTTSEKFFLLSRGEIYSGFEVSSVNESSSYPYYANYSKLPAAGTGEDSNRIKYRGETAQYWWLRTPYSLSGNIIRDINPTGGVGNNQAYGSSGVAPACNVI